MPSASTPARIEPLDIEEPAPVSTPSTLGGALYTLLALPLNVLAGLLRLLLGLLPRSLRPGVRGAPNFYRAPPAGDPRAAADRWLRALEEETGAGAPAAEGLRRRGGERALPPFVVAGYDAFLKLCADEARVGCVVLVSDEHDDVPAFKR
jgi:FAS-associated factor 2